MELFSVTYKKRDKTKLTIHINSFIPQAILIKYYTLIMYLQWNI